jgi:hypothetical protein
MGNSNFHVVFLCGHGKILHVFTNKFLRNEATSDSRCNPMINDLVVSFSFSCEEDEAAAALRLFMRFLASSLEVPGNFVTAHYIFGTLSTAIDKRPRIGRLCSETEADVRRRMNAPMGRFGWLPPGGVTPGK